MNIKIVRTGILLICLAGLFASCSEKANPEITETGRSDMDLITRGPGQFLQAHHLIRTMDGESQPAYETGDLRKEFRKAKSKLKFNPREDYDWIERGPGNVGGRTRGLIIDPADSTSRTWFLGSAGGGIWHTTNAGKTWNQLTPEFASLATSTLAMAESNNDVIYVGTGESLGTMHINAIAGAGIWKSIDRGQSWTLLDSTANNNFTNVTRIVINPEDENEVLASTRTTIGANNTLRTLIMKSVDGGLSWRTVYARSSSTVEHLVIAPNDPNVIYGTLRGEGLLRSIDRGETWELVWQAPEDERRIEMAISPYDDGVIYMSCELPSGGSRLYYSRDTLKTVIEPLFLGRQPDWLVNQGWYDNTIAVHPFNDSIVWVAGQGPMLELKIGDTVQVIKFFDNLRNLAVFASLIDDSPFSDEPAGTASDLFESLPISTETGQEDIVNVELRFGDGASSKAHLIEGAFDFTEFRFVSMIDVPFEAWDNENNRQIAISIFDMNADGEWTFEDFSNNGSFPFHDIIMTNNLDYSETPHPRIETENAIYKAQYYAFIERAPNYAGPRDTLPFGLMFFNTGELEGIVGSFDVILDGYRAYSDISDAGTKGVHVDHHNIVFVPKDSASNSFFVLNANDGGVAFSEDSGESFKQTGDSYQAGIFETIDGYNTSQFYGVDKKNGESRYVGGTQDNGSWVSPVDPDSTSKWVEAPSGDGFEAAWHYQNTKLVLETSQRNRLYKSYNEGETWKSVDLPESRGPFITRLASSQINPDLIFMVSDTGVLRSADFAETWEIIEMPENWEYQGAWGPPIVISLADPDYVWTGSRVNEASRICYSVDGGLSFQQTRIFTEVNTGLVTGIATHPYDPNVAYVLFSQKGAPKILMTDDLGMNWRDLSGFAPSSDSKGFPDVAVYSLLVMPWDDQVLWAGTEIGIFESIDGGQNWEYADNGLPPLSIWQMKIVNDEIVVATHGRGIWTLNTEQFDVSSVALMDTPAARLDVFPNPVNNLSQLEYELNEGETIKLSLYSMSGQLIQVLYQGNAVAGNHSMAINADDLTPGMYLLKLEGDKSKALKKIIVY